VASMDEKRAYVTTMYPSFRWQNKVKHMSDIQVTAIYLKEKKAGFPDRSIKKEKTDDDIPF